MGRSRAGACGWLELPFSRDSHARRQHSVALEPLPHASMPDMGRSCGRDAWRGRACSALVAAALLGGCGGASSGPPLSSYAACRAPGVPAACLRFLDRVAGLSSIRLTTTVQRQVNASCAAAARMTQHARRVPTAGANRRRGQRPRPLRSSDRQPAVILGLDQQRPEPRPHPLGIRRDQRPADTAVGLRPQQLGRSAKHPSRASDRHAHLPRPPHHPLPLPRQRRTTRRT